MPLNIVFDLLTAIITMPLPWIYAAIACCVIGVFLDMITYRGRYNQCD